jgi:hypothetical protein
MHIGVTATQRGLTLNQKIVGAILLKGATTMHNGLCIGGDEDFLRIADSMGIMVVGHPPTIKTKMTKYVCQQLAELRPPLPYLVRNHNIVHSSLRLVAGPAEDNEVLRSGTWSTVRYARSPIMQRPTFIILPGGSVRLHHFDIDEAMKLWPLVTFHLS